MLQVFPHSSNSRLVRFLRHQIQFLITPIFKGELQVREHTAIFHKNISEKSGVGKFERKIMCAYKEK